MYIVYVVLYVTQLCVCVCVCGVPLSYRSGFGSLAASQLISNYFYKLMRQHVGSVDVELSQMLRTCEWQWKMERKTMPSALSKNYVLLT